MGIRTVGRPEDRRKTRTMEEQDKRRDKDKRRKEDQDSKRDKDKRRKMMGEGQKKRREQEKPDDRYMKMRTMSGY
jgi:hypothetical protein